MRLERDPMSLSQWLPYSEPTGPFASSGGFYSGFPPQNQVGKCDVPILLCHNSSVVCHLCAQSYGYGSLDFAGDSLSRIAIPLTALYSSNGAGLTLVVALPPGGDAVSAMPAMTARTSADNRGVGVDFDISGVRLWLTDSPVGSLYASEMYLAATAAADWRPALAWYVGSWPGAFEPAPGVNTSKIEGAMQYGDWRNQETNTTLLRAMGLRVNWDATFMFPFWGQWLGEDGAEAWLDCTAVGHMDTDSGIYHPQRRGVPPPGVPPLPGTGQCESASAAAIAGWYASLKNAIGAETLVYANLFEWVR